MDGDQQGARQPAARLRQVLQSYDQQLLTARRLAYGRARFQKRIGGETREPDPEPKRLENVAKIASEMYTALRCTGISQAASEEIRQELGKRFKMEFEFVFPPNSNLCVYVKDGGKRRMLTPEENALVSKVLAAITSQKVEKNMLRSAPRAGLQLGENGGENGDQRH